MDFMNLFQGMQEKLQQTKAELEDLRVESEAGDGAVTVVVSGTKKIKEVRLGEIPADKEELEDLLVVALNRAMDKIDVEAAEKMRAVTGGLGGFPGLPGF